jgi:hypothetical protein
MSYGKLHNNSTNLLCDTILITDAKKQLFFENCKFFHKHLRRTKITKFSARAPFAQGRHLTPK